MVCCIFCAYDIKHRHPTVMECCHSSFHTVCLANFIEQTEELEQMKCKKCNCPINYDFQLQIIKQAKRLIATKKDYTKHYYKHVHQSRYKVKDYGIYIMKKWKQNNVLGSGWEKLNAYEWEEWKQKNVTEIAWSKYKTK